MRVTASQTEQESVFDDRATQHALEVAFTPRRTAHLHRSLKVVRRLPVVTTIAPPEALRP